MIQQNEKEGYLSQRQAVLLVYVPGIIRSAPSFMRLLGWVSSLTPREAYWKVPRYEPCRINQIWGDDWIILSIDYTRHSLLTIFDYFSCYIVVRGAVKTVMRLEV